MVRRMINPIAVGSALLLALLAGCGSNPNGLQYDANGNPINSAYGDSYGSTYGSGYDSSYGSDYGSGSSYGSDYGSSYGSDYGSGYTSASPSPTPSSSPTPPPAGSDRPVLSAWVVDVKETGMLGLGKVIAKVEITNPSDRTLSGKLEVRFLDKGKPTANKQTRQVTLAPFEKQVLTFTASAWRLDDAEAVIETDGINRPATPAPGAGASVVKDRS